MILPISRAASLISLPSHSETSIPLDIARATSSGEYPHINAQ